jgi:hypothetical protein
MCVYCFSHAPQDSVSEGAYLSSVIFSAGPPLLQGGHIVSGDIVSPMTLSSRCWYRLAKSAMDFFGCCTQTKNSLTVQDSMVDVALAPSLLYSFFEVVRAPLRSVEYL